MSITAEPSPLAQLIGNFGEDTRAVLDWLGESNGYPRWDRLTAPSELVSATPPRPADNDPAALRSIGIIGGGTAGYLTALALKTRRPWLDVSLVESSAIPIIGVGEATVTYMVLFLHHYLGIEPAEFYRRVQPTWKLGIRFDWGPRPEGFMAPFDWGVNSVGLLGSLADTGNINDATFEAMLMAADRAPVYRTGGRHASLLKYLPFAYHLDNARLVRYLAELARERGVRHVDATVADVTVDGPDHVGALKTDDGRQLRYDFYVDCTGFRSLLLGKALGTGFESYDSSLFTDSALTGTLPHGGHLKPYTTATTMNAGWCWTIPTPESDHLGYVFSSSAISPEKAEGEFTRRFPGVNKEALVRFRVGRHKSAWRGNVMAIGNSYAFVEPLESTGLLMIANAAQMLVSLLPSSATDPDPSATVNMAMAQRWDAIRWFLSIHYRFNRRLDTDFWKEARSATDISGAAPLLDIYAAGAPLSGRDPFTRYLIDDKLPIFYGLAGIDTLLLGQGVPARMLPAAEEIGHWRARRAAARTLATQALPQRDALAAFSDDPALNHELLNDSDSWAGKHVAVAAGLA